MEFDKANTNASDAVQAVPQNLLGRWLPYMIVVSFIALTTFIINVAC